MNSIRKGPRLLKLDVLIHVHGSNRVSMAYNEFIRSKSREILLLLLLLKSQVDFVDFLHFRVLDVRVLRRASDFESGLSLEEMLQLTQERAKGTDAKDAKNANAKDSILIPSKRGKYSERSDEMTEIAEVDDAIAVPSTPVLIPEVLEQTPNFGRLEEAAALPCVFCPSEQGERPIGVEIELKFWQDRYRMLWEHAQKRTAGAVAVRFSKGSMRRSPNAFALWPAEMKDGTCPSARRAM